MKFEDFWPEDIRWIRKAFIADWKKWTEKDMATAGSRPPDEDRALIMSPRFYVARDGQLLDSASGIEGWKSHIAPTLGRVVAAVAPSLQFDGPWTVTQACPDHNGAKGYKNKYRMTVTDGFARALWGKEGTPDSLALTGKIQPDGSVTLVGKGLTGDAKYNLGGGPAGAAYTYSFPAQFTADKGLGTRTIGRPCTFTFTRD